MSLELSPGMNIFSPKTLSELLATKERCPRAILWAGGTAIMRRANGEEPNLGRDIISLSGIGELKKIRRTERYLEIGAGVLIKKILNVGQHVLPFALAESLKSIASPHIRNRATIGGNLSCKEQRLNSFSILSIMETLVRLESSKGGRWIQLGKMFNKAGEDAIKETEVLTRIRIPLSTWNIQFFNTIGDPILDPMNAISFTVLAYANKGILNNVRFAVGNIGKTILRSMDFESYLTGKKLRLGLKDIEYGIHLFKSHIDRSEIEMSPLQKERAVRFTEWFLLELRSINPEFYSQHNLFQEDFSEPGNF